jgi:hypothetical protein
MTPKEQKEKNSHKFYKTIYREEKDRIGKEEIEKAMQLLFDYHYMRLKRHRKVKER